MDKEISQNLKLILKKRGIDIHTAAAVQGVEAEGDQYVCKYIEKEKRTRVQLLSMYFVQLEDVRIQMVFSQKMLYQR